MDVSEQPAGRYRTFQWLETAAYTVSAGLSAALGFRRIRARLA